MCPAILSMSRPSAELQSLSLSDPQTQLNTIQQRRPTTFQDRRPPSTMTLLKNSGLILSHADTKKTHHFDDAENALTSIADSEPGGWPSKSHPA